MPRSSGPSHSASTSPPARKNRPPLDEARLRDLALHYAGRYATSRAKLAAYLARKLAERGWAGDTGPDIDALVGKLAELRYVDDAAYAVMKASGLARSGYGSRRVGQALRAAGIDDSDAVEAQDIAAAEAWRAADVFARRKRIGPYAPEPAPREIRERQVAAFLRAGHRFDMARKWVDARPGEMPDAD